MPTVQKIKHMARETHYIQLQQGDDVPHVRDRLAFLRGQRALIVWPEQGTALRRKLDLVMIQREARRRAIYVALVTHDKQVLQNAQELGISAFETIQQAERSRWKRGWGRVFVKRHHKPAHEPEAADLKPVASRIHNARMRSRVRTLIERVIVVVVLLFVTGSTAYIVLPQATITIPVLEQALTVESSIRADTNPVIQDVDVENRIIPGTIVSADVQTSVTIQTTGREQRDASPAIGIVVFTNQTPGRLTIPVGTQVSTSTGTPVVFQTVTEGILPGGAGQTVEVAIEAADPATGADGNVGIGQINTVISDLREQITVRNLSPTTGGETRILSIITEDDHAQAQAQARVQLQSNAYNEMQRNLSATQRIVIETISIAETRPEWTVFSGQVGVAADTLALQMRGIVRATVIDLRLAQQIVFAELSTHKPRGLVLQPDSITYAAPDTFSLLEDGRIAFIMSGQARVGGQINTTGMQERLAGMTIEEARQSLQQMIGIDPDRPVNFNVQPEWYGDRLPMLPMRIVLQLDNAS